MIFPTNFINKVIENNELNTICRANIKNIADCNNWVADYRDN